MSLSTTSNLFLNTPKDGDSTASLGNLFQCQTALSQKKGLLISKLNLPWCNLRLFPVVNLTSVPGQTMEFFFFCWEFLKNCQSGVY